MIGWIATALFILAFVALAVMLTRRAAKRWWEVVIVVVLAALLIKPFYMLTGDVSAVLPPLWSEGGDGKDQIILVSIAATFFWPLIAAALAVWAVKGVVKKARGAG